MQRDVIACICVRLIIGIIKQTQQIFISLHYLKPNVLVMSVHTFTAVCLFGIWSHTFHISMWRNLFVSCWYPWIETFLWHFERQSKFLHNPLVFKMTRRSFFCNWHSCSFCLEADIFLITVAYFPVARIIEMATVSIYVMSDEAKRFLNETPDLWCHADCTWYIIPTHIFVGKTVVQ